MSEVEADNRDHTPEPSMAPPEGAKAARKPMFRFRLEHDELLIAASQLVEPTNPAVKGTPEEKWEQVCAMARKNPLPAINGPKITKGPRKGKPSKI